VGEVAQTMYTHVSKCKTNKIFLKIEKTKSSCAKKKRFILCTSLVMPIIYLSFMLDFLMPIENKDNINYSFKKERISLSGVQTQGLT
jgi:hypothetical protein